MSKLEEQFKTATRHVVLDSEDKALMRERLVSYMEHKPLRTGKVAAKRRAAVPFFGFFRTHHFSGALAIALLATTSTFGMSFAAGDALPGDLLYPVKVNVNEEVKGVFKISREAQLEFERERAELRLKEASQLASEGRLDQEKQEAVAKLFAEHTEKVAEKVQEVEESDPVLAAEVSTEFEAALDTHEAVLARLIVEDDENGNEGAQTLVEQVRNAANEAEKLREEAEGFMGEEEVPDGEPTETVEGEGSEDIEEVAEEDDTASKAQSANLRERAAYRAKERAEENLVHAEELLTTFEIESDLTTQARLQIESGKKLMSEGETALADNDLGRAYASYRKAAASFQKVAQFLEIANLFSVEILPESEPVEIVLEEGAEAPVEDDEHVASDAARAEAESKIREAQTLLLTKEGYDANLVGRANALIKDAIAHMMRGDIALVLEEYKEATKLFTTATDEATRAYDLLMSASGTTEVPVPAEEEPAEEVPATTTLRIEHSYSSSTHTYSGTLSLPTPCTVLESEVLVMESFPEQIVVNFSTIDTGAACIDVIDERSFSVEAVASEQAVLTGVNVNGEPLPYEVVEAADEGPTE